MTLAEIRQLIRDRIDVTDTNRWTDEKINRGINLHNRQAYILIYKKEGFWVSGEKEYAIDLVNGSNTYSIPNDIHMVSRVEVKSSSNSDYAKLTPFNERQIDTTIYSSNQLQNVYRIQNRNIIIYPTPDEDITDGMKLIGKAYPDELSDDLDELNVSISHIDYIIAGCAYDYTLAKTDNRLSVFNQVFEQAKKDLQADAPKQQNKRLKATQYNDF
mgnify:CR=1 FL=1